MGHEEDAVCMIWARKFCEEPPLEWCVRKSKRGGEVSIEVFMTLVFISNVMK